MAATALPDGRVRLPVRSPLRRDAGAAATLGPLIPLARAVRARARDDGHCVAAARRHARRGGGIARAGPAP